MYHQAPLSTEDDDGGCCYETKKQLEEQPAVSVLDNLYAIIRAKRAQMASMDSAMREARMEALYHEKTDHAVALSHVRIALEYQERHRVEQLKYENLLKLIGRLETAHRDLAMHAGFFAASKTLRDVIASMGDDTGEMMDQLREHVHVVQEQDQELSRTIFPEPSNVLLERELDEMVAKTEPKPVASVGNVKKIKAMAE